MERDERDLEQTKDPSSVQKGETQPAGDATVTEEEAKRQAMRKRKPLGPVVKPLSKEQIEKLLGDPEVKERDNLLDALPKGWDNDYQDEF